MFSPKKQKWITPEILRFFERYPQTTALIATARKKPIAVERLLAATLTLTLVNIKTILFYNDCIVRQNV